MKIWRGSLAVLTAASLLGLAGCAAFSDAPAGTAPTTAAGGSATVQVAVAFYPFQFIAERVGGDQVSVQNLTAPGAEPHDLELTAQQVASLSVADLVVFQTGFQPAVDTAVQQAAPARVVDTASFLTLIPTEEGEEHEGEEHEGEEHEGEEHDHGANDPHTWLDPTNMVAIAEHVRDALSAARPEAAEQFAANTDTLVAELTELDATIKADLTGCRIQPFITSHEAFGYLAKRYGLTQVGIAGIEPDTEPTAARIAEVQRIAKENKVTTIFFETLVSPAVAESIAGDLGLKTDVLDPLEGITAESRGTDYLEVMKANGASLKTANQCS